MVTVSAVPIMLEMNLLRSVGGIHRALIGCMAGQVTPCWVQIPLLSGGRCFSRVSANTGDNSNSIESDANTYQQETKNRPQNGNRDVTVSRGHRSQERYGAGGQHTVPENSLGAQCFRESAAW